MSGWSDDDVLEGAELAQNAKNDVYGSLYYYLRNLLKGFCQRLAKLRLAFILTVENAKDLSKKLKEAGLSDNSFDRVEVRF